MVNEFNCNSYLCRCAGCTNEDIENCCPSLSGNICNPKKKLLEKYNVTEENLLYEEVTVSDIKKMLKGEY